MPAGLGSTPEISPTELEGFLFQSSPIPMWVYAPESLRFLAVNQAAVIRYGYSQEEFRGMTLADIRPEGDVLPLRESFDGRRPWEQHTGVWRHRDRSGKVVWAEVTSQDVTLAGRPARLVTAPDVTESRRTEEENRLLSENMADIVSILGEDGRYLYVSPSVEKATGYTVAEALSLCACELYHPEEAARIQATCIQAFSESRTSQTEWRRRCKDGSYRWFETKLTRLADQAGLPRRLLCESRDIQQRKEAEDALRHAQGQYRSIFENAVEGIFQTTPEGRYLTANPALARIYGYNSSVELIAQIGDIANGLYVTPGRRTEFIRRMQAENVVINFEAEVRRKDGNVIWIRENAHAVHDSQGGLLYYEGTVEDITDRKMMDAERERLLEEATARADRDPLTGLWNHRVFHKRLKEVDAHARQGGAPYTVLLLDLDNFRFFNDAHGHAAGDDLLRRVAAVLRDTCRSPDTLARFGGDEFALLLPETDAAEAGALVGRLAAGLRDVGYRPPGDATAIPLHVTHGIGIYPADGPSRKDVLATADARLLHAKAGGETDAAAARLRHTLSGSLEGFSMLDALVTAVDNKDRYTRRHSEDVLGHCRLIADALSLDTTTRHTLSVAALLHDLGKIGVPDAILRKPGRLTEEEFEAVKQHPLMGSVIVAAVPGLEETLDAIRHHHEQWDGGGYPFGLCGTECPLTARVMAVADAFSAMTMDRPYRVGMPPARALAILEHGAGTQWDPACVHALMQARGLLEVGEKFLAA